MLDINACWFLGAVLFTAASTVTGVFAGSRTPGIARASIGAAVSWMVVWAWLVHRPAVALEVVPVELLSRIEGFGGVPAFMFLLGVLWSRTFLSRQRVLVGWAAVFGGVYFVNGGLWLLQDTPASVMANTYARQGMVLQSQDYSCVPASCATALNLLGVPSTEAQMATMTDTRPGTGATVLRALRGLNTRLSEDPLRANLMEITAQGVQNVECPALTALQFEPGRMHMVVILGCRDGGVWLMDPMSGIMWMTPQMFQEVFTGQVIVFQGSGPGLAGGGPDRGAGLAAVSARR